MSSVYLHDIPLDTAWNALIAMLEKAGLWGMLDLEEIQVDELALGRALAEPVWAQISSPHYHASAMDGFALRAEDTSGAMPTNPVDVLMGERAVYVDTGDPLPAWANAVVPIENVEPLDPDGKPSPEMRSPHSLRLRAALTPWMQVRPMGEDIVATQLVLPSGHVLRPVDLGAIAGAGFASVKVARKPKVGIIPTGTELVPAGTNVKAGDIIEYNSIVLAAQVKVWGGEPKRYPIIPDVYGQILSQVQQAAEENDLVLVNAGSSAGSEDFTARIVDDLGEILFHGVAVRPGHPVIAGIIHNAKNAKKTPVIGVPGYPVSCALTGEIFVQPMLHHWLGIAPVKPQEIEARITRKVASPAGDDDFVRVVLGRVGDDMLAAPLTRGAGVITSLVRADGLMLLPRGTQGVEPGAKVKVRLYRSPQALEETIFCIGSHDMSLDLLAQELEKGNRRLVSANVGSLGGLLAVRRGETHMAGTHLLDEESGEYNLSYIARYLPDTPVKLVTWVEREQGLIVLPGNPKGIKSLNDLVREDVRFSNRQRGAGTRVLLDYHLKLVGLDGSQIGGYEQEEYTHLAVAAAVASGRADCGLGVTAAARALKLDFIPLYQERYDLCIPVQFFASELLAPVFTLMHNNAFKAKVAEMPGYSAARMGEQVLYP
jgi:putative molybdopterin biosynthesis protein